TYAELLHSVERVALGGFRFSNNYADARNALMRHWQARRVGKTDETQKAKAEFLEACRHVTFHERERVEGLEADLEHSLNSEMDTVAAPTTEEIRAEMARAHTARTEGDFDLALSLLRKNQKAYPISNLTFLRGRTWSAAGDSGMAALFLE